MAFALGPEACQKSVKFGELVVRSDYCEYCRQRPGLSNGVSVPIAVVVFGLSRWSIFFSREAAKEVDRFGSPTLEGVGFNLNLWGENHGRFFRDSPVCELSLSRNKGFLFLNRRDPAGRAAGFGAGNCRPP